MWTHTARHLGHDGCCPCPRLTAGCEWWGPPHSSSNQVLNASSRRGYKPLGGPIYSGLGAVGSWRVRHTSAPLSGVLHFHFAVGLTNSVARPGLLSARPLLHEPRPGSCPRRIPSFPVCRTLHLPSWCAFYQMAMALTMADTGQLAWEALPFLTSYRFSSEIIPSAALGRITSETFWPP